MLSRSVILALLATTAASPILAQSLPGNAGLSGWIELEYFSTSDDSEIVLGADVTLKLRPDSLQGFGLDFGVQGTEGQSLDTTALYAAIVMPLAGGELSFGAPRSALREIFQMPVFGGVQALSPLLGVVTEADILTSLYLVGDVDLMGLRYDNSYGAARVSAGFYVVEQEAKVVQLAMEYSLSNAKLRFGLENLSVDGDSLLNIAVGATSTMGQFDLSAAARHVSGSGTDAVSGLRLDGVYHANDKLALTASYLTVSEEISDIYGLSAAYDITQSAYVQGGMLVSDGESTFDVSLGVKF